MNLNKQFTIADPFTFMDSDMLDKVGKLLQAMANASWREFGISDVKDGVIERLDKRTGPCHAGDYVLKLSTGAWLRPVSGQFPYLDFVHQDGCPCAECKE